MFKAKILKAKYFITQSRPYPHIELKLNLFKCEYEKEINYSQLLKQ